MKAKLFLAGMMVALVAVVLALQQQTTPPDPKPEKPPEMPAKACLKPGRIATVQTSRGIFKFVLYEVDMPVTCKNFADLVGKGFYNKGLKFHRVEPYVVQTGDPKGDGTGGSGKKIKLEIKTGLGYDVPYMVGMARTDDVNSATSQFFINRIAVAEWTFRYAAFGRVFEGQKVINQLKKGDLLKGITLSTPTPKELEVISHLKQPPGPPPAAPSGHTH